KEDRDVAHFLERRLVGEGVRIVKNADPHSAAASDASKIALQLLDRQPRNDRGSRSVSESDRPVELTFFADALLIAIGRTPNLRSLDLKAAGVEFGEKGIRVNDLLQTSQSHIYAAGGVTGPIQVNHKVRSE